MNRATRAIQFIKTMQEHGLKEAAAEEIVSLVENQGGDLATKADMERLEAGIKGNRWALGMALAAVIGGFALLAMRIGDTKADIREIKALIMAIHPPTAGKVGQGANH